jgi:DNA invertase Pin-like site-specific DNA recombinase
MTARAKLRCAIYTRKSSDEGLDQAFNSLDAQREAGEAYVKSQASEGWRTIATCYDDGGFSGGTMERPGLQRLLGDIEAGLVDVVVVYKIDRLTRSLADFARIVERFDARGISFVSVTQAFNTTSSMGRLTLNVLLSFAQFEREVTGERIRDKIAASKAKGMWMGGMLPLGYDLPAPGTRTLLVNDAEAKVVRAIFARYLELGSVHRLCEELRQQGTLSKRWTTTGGKAMGGVPFSRGALFHLLRSRLYLGQIVHRNLVHDGAHHAIIEPALFSEVQTRLDDKVRRGPPAGEPGSPRSRLGGRVFDAAGEKMSPVFSRGRGGRIYRYYVSASLQQGASLPKDGVIRRIAAASLERLVEANVVRILPSLGDGLAAIDQVHLHGDGVEIVLSKQHRALLREQRQAPAAHDAAGRAKMEASAVTLTARGLFIAVALPLRGGRASLFAGADDVCRPDPVLIAALRKAQAMISRDGTGRAVVPAAPTSPYNRKVLRLAFLAPDLQRDILAGRQPQRLTLETLIHQPIPLTWSEQRSALGWQNSL